MGATQPANFEALEAQARTLLAVFIAAGYEAVAPDIIQPAGVFLDVVGEALRGRTYVFTDLNGEELCLRPDLTVPTCRLYLQRHPAADSQAFYSYNGPAFRFQPASADASHPREFRQAGIEAFGDKDAGEADARTLVLVLRALQQAGLPSWRLRIGDVGLFDALLGAANMPERWRRRLRHQFWRPEAFRAELKRLSSQPARSAAAFPRALIDALDPEDPEAAEALVAEHLEKGGVELIGVRSAAEIAEGLLAIAADAKAPPLKPETAALIDSYVRTRLPAPQATGVLRKLAKSASDGFANALEAYDRRCMLLSESGIDIGAVEFSAEFGRSVGYYTGFVFEVVVEGLGPASPVGGGGRYDGLLKAVGAPRNVPAVGGAIHTERLLAVVRGGKR
ncbi:MAG: ATP phosphoribosyltransferase regulatory subunit [Hyphomicrobium sp.]|uniref:ATP phosphoribosyltransferase regulatory subunit n=1 Tax=Hyphomicrobium sp. TaxID=82 RepID=UPI0013256EF0|nr:ATP phosphoribosyltransferase regulatory subunit [Hyphomicrobium sp.]KAB2939317.1 MAG: ATP phosphoribosyltransferase regulatory subunit [Hyphomicrobium sp.]MBZ0209939.1 ATP phosphoribosyltransferase regulatory subunit [Hyphomicrobium sp.]